LAPRALREPEERVAFDHADVDPSAREREQLVERLIASGQRDHRHRRVIELLRRVSGS
jgi:hypothetical protein